MQKLSKEEINKKGKPNPLFKGMKSTLKDPKNYEKIEKRLQEILKTNHVHKTISAYVKCPTCQDRRQERQKQMKKEGFKSIEQYMEWKRIMSIIINKKNFQIR